MTGHLMLIDCSGFVYRAYYRVTNPSFRESDGLPTWAVLNFMAMCWRLLGAARADQPTHSVAVFDAPGANFRHGLYPAYKANRPMARAEELTPQLPFMRHAAQALGMTPFERKGYEADDVLVTLAARARKDGMRTTIVSADKDLLQSVEDGWIEVMDPLHRKRMLEADVIEKFGVPPAMVPHVQALAGDAVDGIPGVRGCGLKSAAGLVRRFGGIEEVLKHAKECRQPMLRVELKRAAGDVRTFLKLTTLRTNVPLGKFSWDDYVLQPVMREHVTKLLDTLGAGPGYRLIFTREYQLLRVVDPVEHPLEWWEDELKVPGQQIPELPQCGFYQRRLAQKPAPFVPARIWREPEIDPVSGEKTGKEWLRCEVNGRPCDAYAEWTRLAMQPIKRADYKLEVADFDHAEKYRPGDPKADPRAPVNRLSQPVPRNPKRNAQ